MTTNFLPSDNCYIPTSDAVFSIGIVTPSGASYNIDINSTAESAVLRPNYSYTRMEGSEYITGNFSLEFWSDILGVIQSIPDLDVQGQMISSAPDGYYTVLSTDMSALPQIPLVLLRISLHPVSHIPDLQLLDSGT